MHEFIESLGCFKRAQYQLNYFREIDDVMELQHFLIKDVLSIKTMKYIDDHF